MDTIFTLGDETPDDIRVNLDDLYEKKKQNNLNTLATYRRILQRIHTRIKVVARQQINHQHCWYVVPEMIIGVPKYDHGECIAYIIDQLKENGFVVKYTHPNLLFISWQQWTPSYVRDEIRKKTGISIDGNGKEKTKRGETQYNKINQSNYNGEPDDPNTLMFGNKTINLKLKQPKKEFRDIDTYKPSGGLIYNQSLLQRIEDNSKINQR
jgi:hypothetical protein